MYFNLNKRSVDMEVYFISSIILFRNIIQMYRIQPMAYALTCLSQCVVQTRVQHKTKTIKICKINNFYQQVIFPGAFKRCQ